MIERAVLFVLFSVLFALWALRSASKESPLSQILPII